MHICNRLESAWKPYRERIRGCTSSTMKRVAPRFYPQVNIVRPPSQTLSAASSRLSFTYSSISLSSHSLLSHSFVELQEDYRNGKDFNVATLRSFDFCCVRAKFYSFPSPSRHRFTKTCSLRSRSKPNLDRLCPQLSEWYVKIDDVFMMLASNTCSRNGPK